MSIVDNFINDARVVTRLHMPIEDVAYTLSNMDYKVNTHIPKNICSNEQDFDAYVQSLNMITKSKGATLEVESRLDGKKITCIYQDLTINCVVDFRQEEWNIYVERKNEEEHFYYYLGEKNTPFLYLMLLINLDAINSMNFRYSLNKKDEDGIRLYYNKKDAIGHFKEIMFHYSKDISKVELIANKTYGTLLDKNGEVLVELRNEYETDDIKLVFSISNMLMLLKIYEIVKGNYSIEEIIQMFVIFGFSISKANVGQYLNVFDKICLHYGYSITQKNNNSLSIVSPKGFGLLISSTNLAKEGRYDVSATLISSGGRIFVVEKENFEDLMRVSDYSFEEVIALIKLFSELSHSDFPYSLVSWPSNNNAVHSRYRKFEYALYSSNGFFNVARGNDYISLDVAAKSGKSYKVAEDGNKYDFVIVDKNDCVQTTYSTFYNEILDNNSKNDTLSHEYEKLFNSVLHKGKGAK